MHSRTLQALISRYQRYTQAENSALTYTVQWAGVLDTDTISTSTWSTEDSGLTIAGESNTDSTTSARLSGTPGTYRAVNKIVTAAGDTHERYVDVTVMDNSGGYQWDYGAV